MQPVFTDIRQIGIVVENLESAVEVFTEKYGFSNWYRFEITKDDAEDYKLMVRGMPTPFGLKVAKTQVGHIEIELIEPTDTSSIHYEFLKKNGPGIHHFQFVPTDFDTTLANMQEKGVGVLSSGVTPSGCRFAYFDSEAELGSITEIAYYPKGI